MSRYRVHLHRQRQGVIALVLSTVWLGCLLFWKFLVWAGPQVWQFLLFCWWLVLWVSAYVTARRTGMPVYRPDFPGRRTP